MRPRQANEAPSPAPPQRTRTTPRPDRQEEDPVPNVPQLRASGNPPPSLRSSKAWIDLIAFLGVLALGGVLIAFGHVTAGSLATICAALGGLFAVWQRLRPPDDPSISKRSAPPDEMPGGPPD